MALIKVQVAAVAIDTTHHITETGTEIVTIIIEVIVTVMEVIEAAIKSVTMLAFSAKLEKSPKIKPTAALIAQVAVALPRVRVQIKEFQLQIIENMPVLVWPTLAQVWRVVSNTNMAI